MMTTASLFAFFSKPQVLISAFTGILGKKDRKKQSDVLKDIELPMKVFAIGIPVVGALVVLLRRTSSACTCGSASSPSR